MEDGRVEPLIVVLQFFRGHTPMGGCPTKHIALKIQYLENNTIEAVQFGNMVEQIQPHMEDGRVEPLINHFQHSRLHINPELSDVKEFRSRLIGDQPSGSVRITQLSSQGGSSGIAELRRGTEKVKTIEEVMSIEEAGQVWIAGAIMSINRGRHDWSYAACIDGDKKVEEIEGKYRCKKCNNDEPKVELRYKVEVVVCDGMRGQYKEEYPETLNQMIGNRLLFRIYVKSGHVNGTDNVHSVAHVCDNKEIVELNLPTNFDIGESDLDGENVKSNNVFSMGAVVSTELDNESPLSKVCYF
ncbi:hypothetical protein PIB30_046095 [Stylosanthes scabra]|uniref:Replication factor A C-terminal domain-containing protein n=1 Tax=Stylosanthes scabra TaxID=79078 RepID=A0ABU6WGB8_9FABA|nr:hypothetical protein [Stylosanthes scabra]